MQVIGWHAGSGGAPHTPGVPRPPHVWPVGQSPQSMGLPHPSPTIPQYFPLASMHGSGAAHVAGTHTLAWVPIPHDWPAGQSPQASILPQPSPIAPQ
jgi:hypothetical protein